MELIEVLRKNKILPIIRNTNPEEIIEKAIAIKQGGINIVEINLTTPQVLEAIKELSPKMIVCVGGIITTTQAQFAIDTGAKVLNSPILQHNLAKFSKANRIPYIAGVTTANEAYTAWKSRIPIVKIYPITPLGGEKYIEDLLRPMPFLNVIPQGNVRLNEVGNYLKAGAIAVGVGRDITNSKSTQEITERIQQTRHLIMSDRK